MSALINNVSEKTDNLDLFNVNNTFFNFLPGDLATLEALITFVS